MLAKLARLIRRIVGAPDYEGYLEHCRLAGHPPRLTEREYVKQFFESLNGLFSGLLIDLRKNKAFLFNDRYGFDRLYFHESGDELYFASEAAPTAEAAMDQCVHKIEQQLRKYKERVQNHKGEVTHGGTGALAADLPGPPEPE